MRSILSFRNMIRIRIWWLLIPSRGGGMKNLLVGRNSSQNGAVGNV